MVWCLIKHQDDFLLFRYISFQKKQQLRVCVVVVVYKMVSVKYILDGMRAYISVETTVY